MSQHQTLAFVFKKKLLLFSKDLRSSEDGIDWKKVSTTAVPSFEGSSPVEFDEMLWIFGSASGKKADCKILVSKDIQKWDTLNAPWSSRSSPALSIFRGKIFMSAGNHPVISDLKSSDSLLNDVWQME